MPRSRKPRAIFICGSLNQTTQLQRVALALPEIECWFSPFFGDSVLSFLRLVGLAEHTILGEPLRARCLAYLHQHGVKTDLEARQQTYDLVVGCTDLGAAPRMRNPRTLIVQEGMTDPVTWFAQAVRTSRILPLWICGSTWTATAGDYDLMCVASEGYKELFVQRGAPARKLRVTGIPNFDDCVQYRNNALPDRGYILACTSDLRETFRHDDRARFIQRVYERAAGRAVHFKLHANEQRARAEREIARHCPGAVVHTEGSAEELIANCDVLFTQYSSVAFIGLALGKEVHSYYDLAELRRLLPIQNGARSAQNIAQACRELLGLPERASQRQGVSA